MGTFTSFRKAYGALKDSTTVGLAKVNSEFKDLDIAVVKATSHVEAPPKECHVRKIFAATAIVRPRGDIAYCINALAKRLEKTRNWIVAVKVLIVIHRTLREGDHTFREELLQYTSKCHILQISNFKDESSPEAWDCSSWVRRYALYLEEKLECYRVLKYDVEAERLTRSSSGASKVRSRRRVLGGEELLEQLPALQELLYRLMACQPEGMACTNFIIQYALALVLKESFKIYCAINDGIISLVDMFFEMPKHEAVTALNVYKRAGQQAENLADFYDFSKRLEIARIFQFPILKQPPPSFLTTMEEYVKEASPNGCVSNRMDEESEETLHIEEIPDKCNEIAKEEAKEEKQEEPPQSHHVSEPRPESPPLISTDDLLGLNEVIPNAAELDESNALALALIPLEGQSQNHSSATDPFAELGTSGWELALVTTHSNSNATPPQQGKLGGIFDQLLLNSLYEDDNVRRELHMQNAGYAPSYSSVNPFEQPHDPFFMMGGARFFAPSTNLPMAMMSQQQQEEMMMFFHHHQQQQQQEEEQSQFMMIPYQYPQNQLPQEQQPIGVGMGMGASPNNPFLDPFSVYPQNTTTNKHENHGLL